MGYPYGTELIMDLHDCDSTLFNRDDLTRFFEELCDLIDMEACDLHFWDDVGRAPEDCQTEPHTKGTSAIQFILTSNITIHALDLLGKVFVNIFSCKGFDHAEAERFCADFFKGRVAKRLSTERL